jgi:UDPglucose 6-dehydrogenase
LIKTGQDYEAPLRIVETVMAVNDQRKRAMARKVAAALGGNLGKTVAVLGLTFKPNTDDMREAPSVALITALKDMGAWVRAYDPAGIEQAKPLLREIAYADNIYACAEGADALVIVTEWEQFRALDLGRLKAVMNQLVMVDLRNVYRPEDMAQYGLSRYRPTERTYVGLQHNTAAWGYSCCCRIERTVCLGHVINQPLTAN